MTSCIICCSISEFPSHIDQKFRIRWSSTQIIAGIWIQCLQGAQITAFPHGFNRIADGALHVAHRSSIDLCHSRIDLTGNTDRSSPFNLRDEQDRLHDIIKAGLPRTKTHFYQFPFHARLLCFSFVLEKRLL